MLLGSLVRSGGQMLDVQQALADVMTSANPRLRDTDNDRQKEPHAHLRKRSLCRYGGVDLDSVEERRRPRFFSIVAPLLEDGASTKHATLWTPLYRAARNGHYEVVSILLERGAKIEAADTIRWTPLLIAALKGHREVVSVLLERGANIEAADTIGWTPLLIAALKGHREVVSVLLERGADIEAAGEEGCWPLAVAAYNGHKEVMSTLVDRGAKIEATDKDGFTALHIAALQSHMGVVDLLLKHGAKIEATCKGGWTPLHLAAQQGHQELASGLFKRGANIEATCKDGRTPLHVAAQQGHQEVASVLLEHEANIEATCKDGRTPLHFAAENGHEKVVSLLLYFRANIEAVDLAGQTPLHSATRGGDSGVVAVLLRWDANIEATNREGYVPLDVAASEGHKEIVALLLDRGANIEAAEKGRATVLEGAAFESLKDETPENPPGFFPQSSETDRSSDDQQNDSSVDGADRMEAVSGLLDIQSRQDSESLRNHARSAVTSSMKDAKLGDPATEVPERPKFDSLSELEAADNLLNLLAISNFRKIVPGMTKSPREALTQLYGRLPFPLGEDDGVAPFLSWCRHCALTSSQDLGVILLTLPQEAEEEFHDLSIALHRFRNDGSGGCVSALNLYDLSRSISREDDTDGTRPAKHCSSRPEFSEGRALPQQFSDVMQDTVAKAAKVLLVIARGSDIEVSEAVPWGPGDLKAGSNSFAPEDHYTFRGLRASIGGAKRRIYSRTAAEENAKNHGYNWAFVFALLFVRVEKDVGQRTGGLLQTVGLSRCNNSGMKILALTLLQKLSAAVRQVTSTVRSNLLRAKDRMLAFKGGLPAFVDSLISSLVLTNGKDFPQSLLQVEAQVVSASRSVDAPAMYGMSATMIAGDQRSCASKTDQGPSREAASPSAILPSISSEAAVNDKGSSLLESLESDFSRTNLVGHSDSDSPGMLGIRSPAERNELEQQFAREWNEIDMLLLLAQRRRETRPDLGLPGILTIFTEMCRSTYQFEDPEFGDALSKILKLSRTYLLEKGNELLDSTAEFRTTYKQTFQSMNLSSTRLQWDINRSIDMLDLVTIARAKQFSIVLLHVDRRNEATPWTVCTGRIRRAVEVVHHDDRPPTQLSLDEFARMMKTQGSLYDEALWLVVAKEVTNETTHPSISPVLRAHAAFRWPLPCWLDLNAPPLYDKVMDENEMEALQELIVTCERDTGVLLERNVKLQWICFYCIATSQEAKHRRAAKKNAELDGGPLMSHANSQRIQNTKNTIGTVWLPKAWCLTRDLIKGRSKLSDYIRTMSLRLRPKLWHEAFAETFHRRFASSLVDLEDAKEAAHQPQRRPSRSQLQAGWHDNAPATPQVVRDDVQVQPSSGHNDCSKSNRARVTEVEQDAPGHNDNPERKRPLVDEVAPFIETLYDDVTTLKQNYRKKDITTLKQDFEKFLQKIAKLKLDIDALDNSCFRTSKR